MGTLGAQVLTVDALGAQVLGFGSKLGSKFGLPMKKHIYLLPARSFLLRARTILRRSASESRSHVGLEDR